jgi:hypothetical protein
MHGDVENQGLPMSMARSGKALNLKGLGRQQTQHAPGNLSLNSASLVWNCARNQNVLFCAKFIACTHFEGS